VDRGDRFGVSAVVFDGQEEMLWMGNAGVSFSHVSSFYLFHIYAYIICISNSSNVTINTSYLTNSFYVISDS